MFPIWRVLLPDAYNVLRGVDLPLLGFWPDDRPRLVAVVSPSRVVRVPAALSLIEAAVRTGSELAKYVINAAVGELGIATARTQRDRAFDTADEAYAYADAEPALRERPRCLHPPGARVDESEVQPGDAGGALWIVTAKREVPLEAGFRPLWLAVLARAAVNTFLLARSTVSAGPGRRLLGVHADAVFVGVAAGFPLPAEVGRTADWDAIMTAHASIVHGAPPPEPPHATRSLLDLSTLSVPLPQRVLLSVDDEYDVAAIAALLDDGPFVLRARVPGAGKTTAAIAALRHRDETVLVLTPTNALAARLRADGIRSMTYHAFLRTGACEFEDSGRGDYGKGDGGSGGDAAAGDAPPMAYVPPESSLVCDEVGMLTMRMRAALFAWLAAHPTVPVLLTVDGRQLPPIETLRVTGAAAVAAYDSVLTARFPRTLELRVNKRSSSALARARVDEFWAFVWGDEDQEGSAPTWTPERLDAAIALPLFRRVSDWAAVPSDAVAITYFRDTADAVGRTLHARAPALVDEPTWRRALRVIELAPNDVPPRGTTASSPGALPTGLRVRAIIKRVFSAPRKRPKGGLPLHRVTIYPAMEYVVVSCAGDVMILVDFDSGGGAGGGGDGGDPPRAFAASTRDIGPVFAHVGATTGHALQGASVDGTVVLFDVFRGGRAGGVGHDPHHISVTATRGRKDEVLVWDGPTPWEASDGALRSLFRGWLDAASPTTATADDALRIWRAAPVCPCGTPMTLEATGAGGRAVLVWAPGPRTAATLRMRCDDCVRAHAPIV